MMSRRWASSDEPFRWHCCHRMKVLDSFDLTCHTLSVLVVPWYTRRIDCMQESCRMLTVCVTGQSNSSSLSVIHLERTLEGDVRWCSVTFGSLEVILVACHQSVESLDPMQRSSCC
jgi:hypothetical protein